jgi:parallel beta-helix repeat protein
MQVGERGLLKRVSSAVMFILLVTSTLTLAFDIQPVKASGTIYIRADGSIDPPTAPISTVDNITYTFTGDIINDSIVIERDNIVVDGAGYTLQGTNASGPIGTYVAGRSNVTIKNTNIKNYLDGIYLDSSSNNSISGNNITANNFCGILLDYSSGNSMSGNNITNNWEGIRLYVDSYYNSISGNNITGNVVGIGFDEGYDNYNSISGNNITNNVCGISFYKSSYNSISGNNVTNNQYGIEFESSSSNSIFHNNFMNNAQQVFPSDSVNVWDDGYPSGGNYWSDYAGNDTYSGLSQNETGSDGIGDTPYIIDANNTDHYPLMSPWAPPDIALLDLTASKTVVGQGFPVQLNVTTENQGSKVECFTMDIYLNDSLFHSENFTLSTGNSTFMTIWNTMGYAMGNYSLSVRIAPLEGETDLNDNSLNGSWVFITIPGDLNGDKTVDIYDAIILANAYNSKPGGQYWNPNADINGDNIVDIYDAIIMANHYNQHYP